MRQKKVDDRNIEKLKRIFKIAAYLLSLVNYLSLHVELAEGRQGAGM